MIDKKEFYENVEKSRKSGYLNKEAITIIREISKDFMTRYPIFKKASEDDKMDMLAMSVSDCTRGLKKFDYEQYNKNGGKNSPHGVCFTYFSIIIKSSFISMYTWKKKRKK